MLLNTRLQFLLWLQRQNARDQANISGLMREAGEEASMTKTDAKSGGEKTCSGMSSRCNAVRQPFSDAISKVVALLGCQTAEWY